MNRFSPSRVGGWPFPFSSSAVSFFCWPLVVAISIKAVGGAAGSSAAFVVIPPVPPVW